MDMARDLWKVPQVQKTITEAITEKKIAEAVRYFFTSDNVTINSLPAILGLLGLAALAWLIFTYFPEQDSYGCDCHESSSGYGHGYGHEAQAKSPADEYSTSASGYGVVADDYEDTGFRNKRAVEAPSEAKLIYEINKASELGVAPDLQLMQQLQHRMESAQGQTTSLLA